ncbi:hypothetical protein KSS87_000947, partial [Heliosperma pusillum]
LVVQLFFFDFLPLLLFHHHSIILVSDVRGFTLLIKCHGMKITSRIEYIIHTSIRGDEGGQGSEWDNS